MTSRLGTKLGSIDVKVRGGGKFVVKNIAVEGSSEPSTGAVQLACPRCGRGVFVHVAGVTTDGCETTCPACGADVPIPNGDYIPLRAAVDLILESNLPLEQVRHAIEDAIAKRLTSEDLVGKLAQQAPELTKLSTYLPKNREEMFKYLGFLVAILVALIAKYCGQETAPKPTPADVHVQVQTVLLSQSSSEARKKRNERKRVRKEHRPSKSR